jgi:hypothetical protein
MENRIFKSTRICLGRLKMKCNVIFDDFNYKIRFEYGKKYVALSVGKDTYTEAKAAVLGMKEN